jgi:hypothetical protein
MLALSKHSCAMFSTYKCPATFGGAFSRSDRTRVGRNLPNHLKYYYRIASSGTAETPLQPDRLKPGVHVRTQVNDVLALVFYPLAKSGR